jgi:O-acetyl-ADP-ribose deacetylase (regulator of RNase III)
MIEFVTGDVLSERAFAHGCNCRGVMGAGIAKHVRDRWPGAYDEYRALCDRGFFKPGSVHAWSDWRTGQHVFNLGTQLDPGPCASLSAIEEAVSWMFRTKPGNGLHVIAIPRIGCGIGGLDWDAAVRPTLERIMTGIPAVLRVYTLPGDPR